MSYCDVIISVGDTGYIANFRTEQISFIPSRLSSLETDDQFLRALDEIAAHDALAAVVPAGSESGGDIFVHRMFNYTTSEGHNADIRIEIIYNHSDTVTSEEDTQDEKTIKTVTTIHPFASLELFRCMLQTFTAEGDDLAEKGRYYTIALKAMGDHRGVTRGVPAEFDHDTDRISYRSYPRQHR